MLKNSAFVGNTGHFDNEIDLAGSEGLEGMELDNIKPQQIVSSSRWSQRDRSALLMLCSFTYQWPAKFDLLRFGRKPRPTRTRSTSCRISST